MFRRSNIWSNINSKDFNFSQRETYYEENPNVLSFFFMNMEIVTNLEGVKFIGTHD